MAYGNKKERNLGGWFSLYRVFTNIMVCSTMVVVTHVGYERPPPSILKTTTTNKQPLGGFLLRSLLNST